METENKVVPYAAFEGLQVRHERIADENYMSEKQIRRICKNNENTIYKGLK